MLVLTLYPTPTPTLALIILTPTITLILKEVRIGFLLLYKSKPLRIEL
jgi:hypothetical protein